MSHLDEGTLHALLDGELDLHEVKEIQAHIGSCAACGTRLREVKEFHGESDRLVGLLEVPTTPTRRTAVAPEPEPVAAPLDDRAVPRPVQRRPLPRTSGPAAEPPPLLLPDNQEGGRSRFMRRMRWAALILVTVGAGYWGTRSRAAPTIVLDPFGSRLVTDSPAGAVLSSEEAAAPAETDGQDASTGDTAMPAPEAKTTATVPKREAPRAQPPPAIGARQQRSNAPPSEDEVESLAVAGAADQSADTDVVANESVPEPDEVDEVPQPNVRAEAAQALRQLDRQRQVQRADAATAALDSIRAHEAVTRPAAAPPAPRTPEQRAQIYLRIGLDEAAKQLGRPVHVIENMSPLFMGLAFGRVSPGADATRPVVRVVYQDPQGRLILLDQQRLRPGQSTAAPGNEPHWVVGEILLHLSGEVGADVLRNWRARVR